MVNLQYHCYPWLIREMFLFQNLLLKLKSESADEYILHFMGMEQLTDLVFYLLLTSHEDILKKVVAIYLPGCLHVTDQGVIWMASAFTSLTKVLKKKQILETETD